MRLRLLQKNENVHALAEASYIKNRNIQPLLHELVNASEFIYLVENKMAVREGKAIFERRTQKKWSKRSLD